MPKTASLPGPPNPRLGFVPHVITKGETGIPKSGRRAVTVFSVQDGRPRDPLYGRKEHQHPGPYGTVGLSLSCAARYAAFPPDTRGGGGVFISVWRAQSVGGLDVGGSELIQRSARITHINIPVHLRMSWEFARMGHPPPDLKSRFGTERDRCPGSCQSFFDRSH